MNQEQIGFFQRLRENYQSLSATYKRIGDYVSAKFDEVIFLSVAQLAEELDTSEAAVVRFAQALGYSGFPDLKKELVNYYRDSVTPAKKVESYLDAIGDQSHLYGAMIQQEIEYLQQSVATLDEETFDKAVERLCNAKHRYIYSIGRANEGLATYFSFRLNRFRLRSTPVSEAGKNLFDKFLLFGQEDLVVNYAFYQPTRDSNALMDYLNRNDIPNLLITDSNIPPMVQDADMVLYARRGPYGVFHSLLVPMAITNALVIAVAQKLGNEAIEALQELNRIRRSYFHEGVAMVTDDLEIWNSNKKS